MESAKDTLRMLGGQKAERRALASRALEAFYKAHIAMRSSPFAVSSCDDRVLAFSDTFGGEVEEHVVAIDKNGVIYFDGVKVKAAAPTVESMGEALRKAERVASDNWFLIAKKNKEGSVR